MNALHRNPSPRTTGAFLSRGEVARLFGVSLSTVTRWARTGMIPALRTPGGHYRFRSDDFRGARREQMPASAAAGAADSDS